MAPKIIIAGEAVELAPISFSQVKRLAPLLDVMRTAANDLEVRDAVVGITAICLGREAEALGAAISYRETTVLMEQWRSVLEWIGLVPEAPAEGEATATSSQPGASTI